MGILYIRAMWIVWLSVCYAIAACREIFDVNTLRFTGYLLWGLGFSATEISVILKNKIAAVDISLKIICLFILAGSHY